MQKKNNNTCRQTDRQTDRNISPDSSDNRNYVIQNYAFYPGQSGSIAETKINTLSSHNKSP